MFGCWSHPNWCCSDCGCQLVDCVVTGPSIGDQATVPCTALSGCSDKGCMAAVETVWGVVVGMFMVKDSVLESDGTVICKSGLPCRLVLPFLELLPHLGDVATILSYAFLLDPALVTTDLTLVGGKLQEKK